jgi:hypothetical protein
VVESHSESARRLANLSSLSPTYLRQAERISAGLRTAGVPEADQCPPATDKDLPHDGPTEKTLSPRGSPIESLGSFGGRGEVGANIIKRVFIE